jgi:serine protease Do
VTDVDAGSLAWQAGIQPGTLVAAVNRKPVKTAKEFHEALADSEKTKTVLLLLRDQQASRYVVLRLD